MDNDMGDARFSYSAPKNELPRCYSCEQEAIVFPQDGAKYCMKCFALARRESVKAIIVKTTGTFVMEREGKLREILSSLRAIYSSAFLTEARFDYVLIRVEGGA